MKLSTLVEVEFRRERIAGTPDAREDVGADVRLAFE